MRKPLLLTLLAVACYVFSVNFSNPHLPDKVVAATFLPINNVPAENSGKFLTRSNFDVVVRDLYNTIGLQDYKLDYEVFRLGLIGYYSLERQGKLNDSGLITIINFAEPSTQKRFYTIDLIERKVKYHSYVAHGRNTGENMAKKFSNIPHSNQSSLGFYVTGETYVGSKGYSLRLDGMENTFNDQIRSRAVVIHAAEYATESFIKKYGRLGRSQGCPALPPDLSREVIDTIKGKSAIFTYFPDDNYLKSSAYLQLDKLFEQLDRNPVELPTKHLGVAKI